MILVHCKYPLFIKSEKNLHSSSPFKAQCYRCRCVVLYEISTVFHELLAVGLRKFQSKLIEWLFQQSELYTF